MKSGPLLPGRGLPCLHVYCQATFSSEAADRDLCSPLSLVCRFAASGFSDTKVPATRLRRKAEERNADTAMPERSLKIARFIGAAPSVAYCDVCRLAFRTRRELLMDADKAKQQLQSDFEKHECRPEPGAVEDALDHIR